MVNIRTGPVITTYEFRLEPGVKISAVQNLAEDLALALRTESVRIERIPGRATVGIEVPNPDPEVIRLRTLLESPEFQHAQSLLTLSLGVDIRGKPFFADLARMPHLLIGGFTGSGKSVGLNAMIMSILYKARPEQVKFILVDPKMVELGVYADIPHLLTPIISDPKKAANALGWAVAEMDQRYRLLAALGVRNLTQYNQLVSDPVQLKQGEVAARPWMTSGDRGARAAALHRDRHRRAGRPDDDLVAGGRGVHHPAVPEGACGRHPPGLRHPAALGRHPHRHHQGELPVSAVVQGALQVRLADDPRLDGLRAPARPRRHALPAAGNVRR